MSKSIRTKAAGAGMAVLLGVGGTVALATASGAQDDAVDDEPVEVTEVEAPDEHVDGVVEADDIDGTHEGEDCEYEEADEVDFADLSPEEQAEIQAEIDELTAALDEAGLSYELVEDDGIAFPEPTDEADWEAFEAVLIEQWADEFAAMSPEEQAEVIAAETAFADEMKMALDEAGIEYQTEVDPVTGVEFPVFDDDVDEDTIDDVLDRVDDDGYGMFDEELDLDDEFELDDFDDEDDMDLDDEDDEDELDDDEVEEDLAA